jgi:flagellar hook-basal body complex protein FliE
LRKNADLKTINEVENEGTDKDNKLVANLANQIEVKNQYLQELEFRYKETAVSLEKMMAQRQQLVQAYNEGLC